LDVRKWPDYDQLIRSRLNSRRRRSGRRAGSRRARTWRACCTLKWEPAPDPVELLTEQARSRVPELVPIRYGRMLLSPFAFFRGAAYVMASDLAQRRISPPRRAYPVAAKHALGEAIARKSSWLGAAEPDFRA